MFSNNRFLDANRKTAELMGSFAALKELDPADALSCIEVHQKNSIKCLGFLDKRVRSVATSKDDQIMWKCLMNECKHRMRVITMNLAFWEKPEWCWDEVIDAMSFITAVCENTKSMLDSDVVTMKELGTYKHVIHEPRFGSSGYMVVLTAHGDRYVDHRGIPGACDVLGYGDTVEEAARDALIKLTMY